MGSGYRTFTAGEVLTASNVQDYLMDQSVMVFADSTARATNIGTANFEEGMVSYLEDSDTVEVYDGSAWASIAPTTNQGLTLINTTSFSAVASQSVNDVFSATYDNYVIKVNISTASNATLRMRLRVAGSDASTGVYGNGLRYVDHNNNFLNDTSTSSATFWKLGDMETYRTQSDILLANPFSTSSTVALMNTTNNTTNTAGQFKNFNGTGVYPIATSFTSFTLLASTGTMTGIVTTYGVNK
jgi:hypothetical protein